MVFRKPKSAPEIRGTPEFDEFYLSLDKNSYLYKIIDESLDTIKQNITVGTKIGKRKFPREYVVKYGITNLFKFNLDTNYRLTYTIIAEGVYQIPHVIEVMDHKTYSRKFKYRSD